MPHFDGIRCWRGGCEGRSSMRPSITLLTALAASFFGATMLACGGTTDALSSADEEGHTTPLSATYCPGAHLDAARVGTCTEPYLIRHGRACDAHGEVCPSIDLLHGDCRCEAGAWSCTRPDLPTGYDPYPDCTDRGVTGGGACYLEGSTCLPETAAMCFTSNVPMCTCRGHSWSCSAY